MNLKSRLRTCCKNNPLLLSFLFLIVFAGMASAEFRLEKQKLKLSAEYENFIGFGDEEIVSPGLKATYLIRGSLPIRNRLFWHFDLQSGARLNLRQNRLSPLILSNRAAAVLTLPLEKMILSGGLYLRHKTLPGSNASEQLVDLFGGHGFHETAGNSDIVWPFASHWEMSISLSRSRVVFEEFPLSNSSSTGATLRISQKSGNWKWYAGYRLRSSDFNRLIVRDTIEFQHDLFQEAGAGLEFSRGMFFSLGYFYQKNDSNNPGFSYHNHRITILMGRELTDSLYLQVYGFVQKQEFNGGGLIVTLPILAEENDNNTMAASLIKTLGKSREIEFGFQRLVYSSSFPELNSSKYIFFLSWNFVQ